MALMAKKRKASWGSDLKALRESFGPEFTQEKAAAYLDVPLSTLRSWEQGRYEPPPYVRKLVRRLLENYPG